MKHPDPLQAARFSSHTADVRRKVRTTDLIQMKKKNKKIKTITCYDASFARIIDSTNVDVALVGDSLGQVIKGKSNTVDVTIDEVAYHVRCVSASLKRALLVADMPFMTTGPSLDRTCSNVDILMKSGAEAVKIEGATSTICQHIEYLTNHSVPVMGHIGLQPQSVHSLGGYKIQGKNERDIDRLLREAKDLQNAGCFSIVIELVVENAAKIISESIAVPTIGIGAGNHCDGNVLVLQDMLGMNSDFKPKFLKTYANLEKSIQDAVNQYCSDVDARKSEPTN